jgi:hypothetical protein
MEQLHSRTLTLLGIVTNIQRKMIGATDEKPEIQTSDIARTETSQKIQYNLISRHQIDFDIIYVL